MSKRKKTRLKNGTRVRAKNYVSTAPMPWNGDHGTGTAAATADTVIVAMDGPNRMAQRRRVCAIDSLTSLTMRQMQAAKAIRDAYGRVDMLSSGGELKEQVDNTPKPDATIAAQVDAQSNLIRCTRRILRADRVIVDHVCQYNRPITLLGRMGYVRAMARFVAAMDRVADGLGY